MAGEAEDGDRREVEGMGEFGGMITNNKNNTKWPVKRIGDLTSIASGSGFPNKYQGQREGDYPFYKVSDMNLFGNEVRMYIHNNAINEVFLAKLKAKVHSPGTIIFPKIGAAIATNKKRILTVESCFDNNVIGIHPSKHFDTNFLYHRLQCKNLSDFANTGNPPSIRKTTIEDWAIPLPPLAEQKRIAAILDAADALRAKRRETLAQLDTLLKSTFLDMFGDPVSNPMGWESSKILGKLADIVSGITKGRKVKDDRLRDVPYLAVANVQDRHLKLDVIKTIAATEAEVEKFALKSNDLLLTEGGDPDKLGRGSLWGDELPECIHQNHIFRVRLTSKAVEPVYLNWIIGSARGKQYFLRSAKQTTGIASINMTQLRAFPMLIPPLDLQRRFATIVESVEKQKNRLHTHLAELDTLFTSLQSRAFNGEI